MTVTATVQAIAATVPSEHLLIRALHRALYTALVPKRDGSRHHRACLNRTVNASPTACSDACEYAVGALLLAEDWEDRQLRPVQAPLFGEAS